MNGKLAAVGRYLGTHAKAYVGAAGSAATLAVSLFPNSQTVQEVGGAVGVIVTFLLVHIVPNASSSDVADADAAVTKNLGQLVHVPSPALEQLVERLGQLVEKAIDMQAQNAAQIAVAAPGVPSDQPAVPDAPAASSEPAAADSGPAPDAHLDVPRVSAPETPPPSEAPAPEAAPEPEQVVEPDPVITPETVGQPADEPPLIG